MMLIGTTLIGIDHPELLLQEDQKEGKPRGPLAVKLDWVLMGEKNRKAAR